MLHFFRKDNGQIAPFMTIVIVIIILAIAATMLIGKMVSEKVRLINTVDSALISTGTEFARSLNLIRQIHFRMLLNYVSMQVMLLARGVWTSKWEAYEALTLPAIEGIIRSHDMYEQAKKIAEKAPKDLRNSIYDRILGGLVDEPKPFYTVMQEWPLFSGQYREALDYERYLGDKTSFQVQYLRCKKGYAPCTGGTWYEQNTYSYAWYRKAQKTTCLEENAQGRCIRYGHDLPAGTLNQGAPLKFDPSGKPYESYLQVSLGNTPREVRVKAQKMVLFFLYICGPSVCPGFIPLPWAWLSRVSISPTSEISAYARKLPFRTFPVFMPEGDDPLAADAQKEIKHGAKVNITGGLWSGYDIKLNRYP